MGTLEYKFVKIEVKIHAFKGVVPVEDNHQIVDQHARDGWRLVQIFVPPIKGSGIADFFELILEREIRSPATDHFIN